MGLTDDNEQRDEPAPQKIPGALTPPVPRREKVEPKGDDTAEQPAKPATDTSPGFGSFES